MPISGPSSYLPTTTEFITHWTSANAALDTAGPILLAKGLSVAGLTALRETLAGQRADVEISRNEVEGTRADIEAFKAALLARLNQFNGKVRSLSPGHRLEAMLPKAYSVSEGPGRVLPPLDDLADVWDRYDSEVAPVTLIGGYSLADFTADLELFKGHYTANAAAETDLGIARAKRNETQDTIYDALKQYRLRIPAEFAEGSAILATLPRLTPLPGHTPAAVKLSGNYDPATAQAVLSWTAPADPAVLTVQLRASVGPEYDPEDDAILGDFPAAGPHQWTGDFGLAQPGTAAAFKAYAITAEGNEKGSNAVTLTRPAA